MRTRTGLKDYYQALHESFSDLRFEVHENVGVLVENDLVALRTVVTGTHDGDYGGAPPTGTPVQTSTSHVFRFRDDRLAEHWHVTDTYRILVQIGRIPGVAGTFQKLIGVPESPGGIFTGCGSRTAFWPSTGTPSTMSASTAPWACCRKKPTMS